MEHNILSSHYLSNILLIKKPISLAKVFIKKIKIKIKREHTDKTTKTDTETVRSPIIESWKLLKLSFMFHNMSNIILTKKPISIAK